MQYYAVLCYVMLLYTTLGSFINYAVMLCYIMIAYIYIYIYYINMYVYIYIYNILSYFIGWGNSRGIYQTWHPQIH